MPVTRNRLLLGTTVLLVLMSADNRWAEAQRAPEPTTVPTTKPVLSARNRTLSTFVYSIHEQTPGWLATQVEAWPAVREKRIRNAYKLLEQAEAKFQAAKSRVIEVSKIPIPKIVLNTGPFGPVMGADPQAVAEKRRKLAEAKRQQTLEAQRVNECGWDLREAQVSAAHFSFPRLELGIAEKGSIANALVDTILGPERVLCTYQQKPIIIDGVSTEGMKEGETVRLDDRLFTVTERIPHVTNLGREIVVPVIITIPVESLLVIDQVDVEISTLDMELENLFGRRIIIRERPANMKPSTPSATDDDVENTSD